MEMGTGKSKVLIDNIALLYDKGDIRNVLIVAPKGVYRNWYEIEVPTHLPEHIEHTTVLWEPNLTQSKLKELDALSQNDGKLKIFIMNVEAFSTNKGVDFAEKFLNTSVSQSRSGENPTVLCKIPKF